MGKRETFEIVKYAPISRDQTTWYLIATYPLEIVSAWNKRCAKDVERLATNRAAKKYIRACKAMAAGESSIDDLAETVASLKDASPSASMCAVWAFSAAYVAETNIGGVPMKQAAIAHALARKTPKAEMWDQVNKKLTVYIGWLLKDLAK
jgi:hypothetical protein